MKNIFGANSGKNMLHPLRRTLVLFVLLSSDDSIVKPTNKAITVQVSDTTMMT